MKKLLLLLIISTSIFASTEKNTTDSDTKLFGLLNLAGEIGNVSTVGAVIVLTLLYGM